MPDTFFYDSYAVLAFTSGHEGYRKYFEEQDGVLTKLNLVEIFYRSLEQHGSKAATNITETFSKYLVDFGLKEVADSMKLRLELKHDGRDISYADALGYALSRKLGVKFLTGDKEFRGLGGVEYLEVRRGQDTLSTGKLMSRRQRRRKKITAMTSPAATGIRPTPVPS